MLAVQVGAGGPEHDGGQGLVGEAEVAPDHVEVHEVQHHADGEDRDGDGQTGRDGGLLEVEHFGDGQAGGTEGRVTGGDGQGHHAQDGQHAADGAHEGAGGLVDHVGGTARSGQGFGAGVEGHAHGGPHEADEAFGHHAAVEHGLALLFIGQAAGHQGRLGGVEAADRAAGDGDEHQREDGQLLGMVIGEGGPVVEFATVGEHGHGHAHGHDDQHGAEQGVEAADDLVDGQDGGQEVVGEDDGDPEHLVHVVGGQLGQQAGGSGHEDHAHEQQEDDGEHAHHLLGHVAQVVTHDGGYVGALVTHGEHAGEVVMHGTGEDGADNDPQQGAGAVQGAQDGAEDGAHTGDVQQLDEPDLPHGHFNVVDAVGHGLGGGGAVFVRTEDFGDDGTVDDVAHDEAGYGKKKVNVIRHSIRSLCGYSG